MIVKLLTEHHMASLSLKSVCTCWSESTHVKILHCWKSHVEAHMMSSLFFFYFLSGIMIKNDVEKSGPMLQKINASRGFT